MNPEQIIAANPDQVIVTGSNWELYVPGGAWVGVGSGADKAKARAKLAALMKRPAYTGVKAVKDKQVHAIWHQFYNSPYQFVAIQQMAKWLHPELFKDLDPDQTMKTLYERFLPVPYKPGYWVSLTGQGIGSWPTPHPLRVQPRARRLPRPRPAQEARAPGARASF